MHRIAALGSPFSPSAGKVGAIQDLRGIAAILVLLLHAINVVDDRLGHGLEISHGAIATFMATNDFGASGVDLFFVISGFIMALLLDQPGKGGRGEFLRKRFVRVVPLFWLAMLAYATICLLLGQAIPLARMIAGVTIVPINPFHYDPPVLVVGWTLAFELGFYMLVTIVLPWRKPALLLSCFLGALAAVTIVHPMHPGLLAALANPIQLEFLWGIGVYGAFKRLAGRRSAPAIGLLLFLSGGLVLALQALYWLPFNTDGALVTTAQTSLRRALLWGLPWACFTTGYVLIEPGMAEGRSFVRRVLRFAGAISYSLYLTHLSICLLFEQLLPARLFPADVEIVMMIVTAGLTAAATHKWIEKPLLAALSRMRWRRFTPPFQPAR